MTLAELDEILAAVHVEPGAADEPLALTSLQVVSLVDHVEATFDVALTSRDVTRANFKTRATLAALFTAKGIGS